MSSRRTHRRTASSTLGHNSIHDDEAVTRNSSIVGEHCNVKSLMQKLGTSTNTHHRFNVTNEVEWMKEQTKRKVSQLKEVLQEFERLIAGSRREKWRKSQNRFSTSPHLFQVA